MQKYSIVIFTWERRILNDSVIECKTGFERFSLKAHSDLKQQDRGFKKKIYDDVKCYTLHISVSMPYLNTP